eukprot:CAMPEP_0113301726 /NCGR_PEP_ID=MMETSP0010_2-20120614/2833_1 /TAXON_ID=216773 ORGANISM="Corethron hystrix, Strain 308" /NCGR_SAMPLE_ID=MMETSP0010_2 /ASSEMBLY_ACC=CAM_ASM_000155 /LENGTH=670 /DNA_ID=CAMNT_0000155393 /DNA_START=359 /DNA_END=2368 /DNA_ORIENTATION=+ /assembly_acc=CAM_ASM_000155
MVSYKDPPRGLRNSSTKRKESYPPVAPNFDRRPYRRDPSLSNLIRNIEKNTLYHTEKSRTRTRDAPDIEYKNHPWTRRRKLQNYDEEPYTHMRITFDTTTLFAQNFIVQGYDETAYVTATILPRLSAFFSAALKVVPIARNLVVDATRLVENSPPGSQQPQYHCGHKNFGVVPPSHTKKGVAETDVIVYVSGSYGTIDGEKDEFCDEEAKTLAVAVSCSTDQYDRPIAGSIHFCLKKIGESLKTRNRDLMLHYNMDVAVHEMSHILGMSYNSFRYFRDSDTGIPLTPRPIIPQMTTCMDGSVREEHLPSSKILKVSFSSTGAKRRAYIVTNKVRQVVRNQFNCQDLIGAQLENIPTGMSCFGDHWDERAYYSDSLSGILGQDGNHMSAMTLALFEDSGWYKADYSVSELSPWGHGAGCGFVEKDCIDQQGQVSKPGKGFFCPSKDSHGCNPGHTHKADCSIFSYDGAKNIPQNFQYFEDPKSGGIVQADYCPIYNGYHDCRNPDNEPSTNSYWEEFGTDSRCFETQTRTDLYSRCYRSACVKDINKAKVLVAGKWHTCNYDFEVIKVDSFRGLKITCPRLASICPDLFCPANCAGNGVCLYKKDPYYPKAPPKAKCQCYDRRDTSPGCSQSLVIEKTWIDNEVELKNVKVSTTRLFDDVVGLFENYPDQW